MTSAHQPIPKVKTSLDRHGRLLLSISSARRALIPRQPLFRLPSGDTPSFRRTTSRQWEAGAAGLNITVADTLPGQHGESRFEIVLRNDGPGEVEPTILPPFAEWADRAETIQAASSQHLLIDGLSVTVGGIGRLATHKPGIELGTFVTVPLRDGRGTVAAQLNAERAAERLRPGETLRYQLHVEVGEGDRHRALHRNFRERGAYRWDPSTYDASRYENPQLAWVRDIVAVWYNWAWDRDVLDPRTGNYRLAESVAKAKSDLGGYDVYVLWPFWPRAGIDDRLQFDHYRDMPGGLDGLRDEVRRVQSLGTRVIAAYCYWSEYDPLVGRVSNSPNSPNLPDEEGRVANLPYVGALWREKQHESFAGLVDVATAIGADGVLMDIFSTTPEEILNLARERGHELAPYNEGDPDYWATQTNLLGRIHNEIVMPPLNLKRYLLPHHAVLRVCESGRQNRLNRNNFVLSFFNGHGVEMATLWPETHPQYEAELSLLARMLDLLRAHRDCFRSPDWELLVDSRDSKVWANRWPAAANGKTLYTLCGADPNGHRGDLLRLPHREDVHYVDLWRYRPIDARVETDDGGAWDVLPYDVDGYTPGEGQPLATGDYSPGCIGVFPRRVELELRLERLRVRVDGAPAGHTLEVWRDAIQPGADPVRLPAAEQVEVNLYEQFGHTNDAIVVRLLDARGQVIDVAVLPAALVRFFRVEPLARTPAPDSPPPKMVRIPGGVFLYSVAESQPVWMATYLTADRATDHYQPAEPSTPYKVTLDPFWMDRYPVTNAEFAEFVRATGYLSDASPVVRQNFLKHFVDGQPPAGLEDHPVVYVSHEDAAAYARWAGKRLPTEEEWQYAAGAGWAEGRAYPWGDDLAMGRYNAARAGTTPVNAHPGGASPFGVEDIVGNVWQWTADVMDNGRHLIVFIRGGGWYDMPHGRWWVRGGPRRINDHHPLSLFGPGMNRFSTVGFRCVKDG